MEPTRSSMGNILLPAHEDIKLFSTYLTDTGYVLDDTKILLHLSNQIYELHQSLYGWPDSSQSTTQESGGKSDVAPEE